MARRGENIYKRKDGRWEGRIAGPDGTYRSVYARTYREVKEKRVNQQEKIRSEKSGIPQITGNSAELFEGWLSGGVSNQVKPSTYENYYCIMNKYVIPFFKESGNERITELSAARFVESVKDRDALAKTTKNKILVVFKTALKQIMRNSAECQPILQIIRPSKIENKAVEVFSIGEQRLVEYSVLNSGGTAAQGIVLCFYTGIRLGELCALRWSDIDFDAGIMSISRTVSRVKSSDNGGKKTMLLVGTPKSGNSTRKIPLPDFMLRHLEELKPLSAGEKDYVISGAETPADPRTYQKLYKKMLACAGVKYRKFHAIRHTFATRALEVGVDIKTLSEILGHANVSITLNIYAHSMMEQKRIAMDKLNNMHAAYMESVPSAVTDLVMQV